MMLDTRMLRNIDLQEKSLDKRNKKRIMLVILFLLNNNLRKEANVLFKVYNICIVRLSYNIHLSNLA